MISATPLSPESRRRSHYNYNYNCYSAVNGLSYMCLGETVLILLAVKIGCPDYYISTLGAMVYLGFLLLPLGKLWCAKIGAAQTLASCWVARNLAALLVAAAAVLAYFGFQHTAWLIMLLGAFLFYGFRAAGMVIAQPLVGNITDDESRGRLIAVSGGLSYLFCVVSLLTITALLAWRSNLWVLTGIIVAGASFGVFASTFVRRIEETEEVREKTNPS